MDAEKSVPDEEQSDTALIHEALACSVRQRSLLSLVERRCAHREANAAAMRAARNRKGDTAPTASPEDRPAA